MKDRDARKALVRMRQRLDDLEARHRVLVLAVMQHVHEGEDWHKAGEWLDNNLAAAVNVKNVNVCLSFDEVFPKL